MNFLLDTNVVSEWVKPRPDLNVGRWLSEINEDELWISVISFGEIRLGIEQLPVGSRRDALTRWLENDLPSRFDGRIVGIGLAAADAWGRILAQAKRSGKTRDQRDAFLAAMAQVRGFTLVTRNTRHLEGLGVDLVNPWNQG